MFPPPGARRVQTAEEGKQIESKLATLVRRYYEIERSSYESLLTGRLCRYQAPAYYAGAQECRFEGGGAPLAKARASTWEKLAHYFLEQRIDPGLYIRVQFEPSTLKLHKPPEPPQLLTAARRALYEVALARLTETIRLSLITQQNTAMSGVSFVRATGRSLEDACAAVITDEGLELSPLFRHCLARSMTGQRFRELSRLYQESAVLQYMCYSAAYEAHWQPYLPLGFGKMAERVYQDLINR